MQTRANNPQETTGPLITRCCTMKLDLDLMTLANLCIHSPTSAGGVQLPFLLASNLFALWVGQFMKQARRILRVHIQILTTTRWQFAQLTWLHEIVNQSTLFCKGSPGNLKKLYKTEGLKSKTPHQL